MAVDSTNFNNPFANPYASMYGNSASSGLNEDFMANAYGICQNDATKVAKDPVFTGNYNFTGQPATDTYQRSSGALPALVLAATAGGATTAGLYHFGGDKINPYKDGKFDDQLLKSLEDKKVLTNEVEALKSKKINEILAKKNFDMNQYNAIKQIAKDGKVPSTVTLPDFTGLSEAEAKAKAKTLVDELDKKINAINIEKLTERATRTHTIEGSVKHLDVLTARKAKLGALAADITTEDLAKHLQDNAKLYGIEGKDATATEARAKKLAKAGLDKIKENNESLITRQQRFVDEARNRVVTRIKDTAHWDSATNTLKKGAPEDIAKAFKNCKLSKAGKWGAGAAIVGAVVGWLFGKS